MNKNTTLYIQSNPHGGRKATGSSVPDSAARGIVHGKPPAKVKGKARRLCRRCRKIFVAKHHMNCVCDNCK